MELWIVRHGQTADNTLRILAGHQPGKLSEVGIQQATKVGKRLAQENFSAIYCSDLGRTRETLDNILLSFPNKDKLNITYSELLREKGAGVLEGKPLTTWKENADKAGLDIRAYKPEHGESWQDVYKRGEKFLDLLIEKYIMDPMNHTLNSDKPASLDNIGATSFEETKTDPNNFEEKKVDISINGKACSSNKQPDKVKSEKKLSLHETKLPKILIVSHGGFIMEFFNLLNFRKSKKKPVYLNDAKNCSINIAKVYHKSTKDVAGKITQEIIYDIVEKNITNHL